MASADPKNRAMSKEVFYAHMDSMWFAAQKYRPTSRSDFGEPKSIRMHLRKISEWENAGPETRCWGIYLGEVNGKWTVATMMTIELIPSGLEKYDTLAELKRDWELD